MSPFDGNHLIKRESIYQGVSMKKLVTIVLVGLLAFGLLGPASAKKKKAKKPPAPVPVEMKFFLRTEPSCEAPFLSLTDGEDESNCFFGFDDMLNEYPQAEPVIGDPVDHYVAADGVPLKLDTTRKVVGSFQIIAYPSSRVSGQPVWFGMGNAEVDVTLKASIAGEEKVLGTFTKAYTAGPSHTEVVDFEFLLDPALQGATVDSLTLDVWTHGTVVFGRGIEHDSDPAPFVTVPALQ
jgi:hypothetical protein